MLALSDNVNRYIKIVPAAHSEEYYKGVGNGSEVSIPISVFSQPSKAETLHKSNGVHEKQHEPRE